MSRTPNDPAPDDTVTDVMRHMARELVLLRALSVFHARVTDELYPDSPHAGDQIDYANDAFADACRDYVELLPARNSA